MVCAKSEGEAANSTASTVRCSVGWLHRSTRMLMHRPFGEGMVNER
jgi:hypothetical protein